MTLGQIYLLQGKSAEAFDADQNALSIDQKLAAGDPQNTLFQEYVSFDQRVIGDLLLLKGKSAEALQSYQNGLTIAQKLASGDPANARWQEGVSKIYMGLVTR